MKTLKYLFLILAMMVIGIVCSAMDKPITGQKKDEQLIVEGNNKFALVLYTKLQAKEGNLFFSPYSISTALAMTYSGARGITERQMSKVLNLHYLLPANPSSITQLPDRKRVHSAFGIIIKDLNLRGRKGNYELTVANALWGQKNYGFLEDFLELIKTNYGGRLNEVDFIERFSGRIGHIHAKNLVRRDGSRRFVPLEEGEIDYTKVFPALQKAGYDGTVAMEHSRPGNPDEATEKDIVFLRRLAGK